jgi:hypothetical protein
MARKNQLEKHLSPSRRRALSRFFLQRCTVAQCVLKPVPVEGCVDWVQVAQCATHGKKMKCVAVGSAIEGEIEMCASGLTQKGGQVWKL